MGSGVAKALYTRFPEVKNNYHIFCKEKPPAWLLGQIQPVQIKELTVVNCFTQLNFGYDGAKYVSYEAIGSVFLQLNEKFKGGKLAIPKIGAGLAGGDWEAISVIINLATPDLQVYVYEL